MVLAALLVPTCGAGLIALCHRTPDLRDAVTVATAGLLLWIVAALLPGVLAGDRPALALITVLPGLDLALEVESFGMLFALLASGLWLVTSLYSIGYLRANHELRQTRFHACFALALAATTGLAFAGNLFTLFLFYELLTLVTYPLVTHHGGDEARRAGRTYLGLLMGTSIMLLLPAVVFIAAVAGTTDFRPGGILAGRVDGVALAGLLALCVFGIGKAALMPVHRWLPAAMVAPAPVSALLHAVAVVKAGVFSVVKVLVFTFGIEPLAAAGGSDWLVYVAGFTIMAASLVALNADNLKRRLAYSTVSQLSYVIMSAALLAPLSLIAAVLHIAAHALGKITLFFAAGAIYTASHKTEVSQLDGIGRRMPWTMGAFAVGALSMIGLPPAAGFVSKWYMLSGAMSGPSISGTQWVAVAVIVGSTLLNAGYFLPIIFRAFFRLPVAGDVPAHGEAPWPMVIALTTTATGTILLFFMPGVPLALARQMLGGG
ncbi:MAG: monovalent cation/H+ antiporter subunit D family protein [Chromatiales bacterium]|nr:monovalent cation/H+ antiporter subunit D family protein [Chromatiales bacterium]